MLKEQGRCSKSPQRISMIEEGRRGHIDYSDDFFGESTCLTVSGQLEGELGATALGAIYTFGPTFRAETPTLLATWQSSG